MYLPASIFLVPAENLYIPFGPVAFSALITHDQIKMRNQFNRKVTDFVVLDREYNVVAIIELDDPSHIGKEQEDAERDAMLIAAGYTVIRYTQIPSIRQLQRDIR